MIIQTRPGIIIGIPCLMLGGSEIASLALVKTLVAGDYHVRICCYYEYDKAMVRRFVKAGAQVSLLNLSRGSLPAIFSRLAKVFRRERPEIVHVQYLAPGMVPILAAKWAGVSRIFATVHAAGQNGYGWKAKAMLRFSARFTDHFFCVSRNAEEFWFSSASKVEETGDWSKIRHSTIYNAVDVACIQAASEYVDRETLCPELPPAAKVVGIVGRLVRLKGHLTLLQAMKDMLAVHPETVLLVIGEGPDEPIFCQEAKRLGIEDRVIWRGRIEPEVLPHYYHLMDILAMPSYWEGFGLSAAEAMAAGKPVVGTDVPGLREVVEDGMTGYLVPVNDARALAEKLIYLLGDDSVRKAMGQSGLDRAARLFDVSTHNRKWLEAYTSLF